MTTQRVLTIPIIFTVKVTYKNLLLQKAKKINWEMLAILNSFMIGDHFWPHAR